jgi:hypothetical protein
MTSNAFDCTCTHTITQHKRKPPYPQFTKLCDCCDCPGYTPLYKTKEYLNG